MVKGACKFVRLRSCNRLSHSADYSDRLDAHAGTKPNDKSSADLSLKPDAQLRMKPGISTGYRLNAKLCAKPGAE